MPYKIIGSLTVFPFFVLFIKPFMYVQMILVISCVIGDFYSNAFLEKNTNAAIVSGMMLLLAVIFPALVETSWYIGMHFYIWIPELMLSALFTAAVYFRKDTVCSVCEKYIVAIENKFRK